MRIRILQVLATLKRAGAERTAVTLASAIDPARFQCELVSLYDAFPGGFEPELAAAGILVHHLGKRPGFDPRVYLHLSRVIRKFRPHIVHTHSYVLRYAWPVRGRAAAVHTVHNLAEREVDAVGRVLHRFAMRRGARFVAISREVARSFAGVYHRGPDAVIPNGVDLPPSLTPRGEWRRGNGFGPDDILILSVARLDPQKNPRLLIDSLPDNPRCHLLLAGDGALAAELRAIRRDRVHFLGVRTDIADLLRASDIFALASDYEGLPVAVIEAMAAGLPIAATAVGGVPELIDASSGILVPLQDRAALVNALTSLAADPALRSQLGAAAAVRARDFTSARMVAAYGAFYDSITGGAA